MFALVAAVLAGFYAFGVTHVGPANLLFLALAFFFLHAAYALKAPRP